MMEERHVPPPWEVRVSARYNRHFYYNTETGESMWELPSLPALQQMPSLIPGPQVPIQTAHAEPPRSVVDLTETNPLSAAEPATKLIPTAPALRRGSESKPYASRRSSRTIIPLNTSSNIISPKNNSNSNSTDSNDLPKFDNNISSGIASISSDTSVISQLSDPTYQSSHQDSKSITPSNLSSLNMVIDFSHHIDFKSRGKSLSQTPSPTPKSRRHFNFIRSIIPQNERGGGSFHRPSTPKGTSSSLFPIGSNQFAQMRRMLQVLTSFSSNSSMNSVNSSSIPSPQLQSPMPAPLFQEGSYEESDEDENRYTKVPIKVIGGLGRGGYSIVVLAQHLETKKKHALKVITKEKVCRAKDQDKLRRELLLMTTIDSIFLQKCHLCFESSCDLFFLLDYIDGGDLFFHLCQRQVKRKKGFSEKELRILLSEVYLGLEHLHQAGYIHRDIKIENIMVGLDGHVKLIDFGLAIEIDSRSSLCGSLLYMTPEMLKDNRIGTFTDWWAVGICFYELFTGHPPWSSFHDKKQIKREIMNIVVTPPHKMSYSGSMFMLGLLKHDPTERLGSTDDLEVADSPFFDKIDWQATRLGQNKPAFIPSDIVKEIRRKSFVSKMKEEIEQNTRIDETMNENHNSGDIDKNSKEQSRCSNDKNEHENNDAVLVKVNSEKGKDNSNGVGDKDNGVGAETRVSDNGVGSETRVSDNGVDAETRVSGVSNGGGTLLNNSVSSGIHSDSSLMEQSNIEPTKEQDQLGRAEDKGNKKDNDKKKDDDEFDDYSFVDQECANMALKEYLRKSSIVQLESRRNHWKFGVAEIIEYPPHEI